jgi:tagaturonate reductase
MNKNANFNSGVVVVQPLPTGMIDMLNEQDGLYHVNLQGLDHGNTVNSIELIDAITRSLNPYNQLMNT